MSHQNYYLQREIARQHQDTLLREAYVTRLRCGPREGEFSYRERLFVSLAELLILSGEKLKGRYQPRHLQGGHELALTNGE